MTQDRQQPDRHTGASETAERLANEGDVLGLLNFLQDEANPLVLRDAMRHVSRCIRLRAQSDLDGLCDATFGRIIGLALLLHSRVELYIANRLTEAEQFGGHVKSGLPADLIEDGWIDRAQRIARFISEMATVRSRVGHVNRLNHHGTGKPPTGNGSLQRSPMDGDPGEAASCQAHTRNGRAHRQASRVHFP